MCVRPIDDKRVLTSFTQNIFDASKRCITVGTTAKIVLLVRGVGCNQDIIGKMVLQLCLKHK